MTLPPPPGGGDLAEFEEEKNWFADHPRAATADRTASAGALPLTWSVWGARGDFAKNVQAATIRGTRLQAAAKGDYTSSW